MADKRVPSLWSYLTNTVQPASLIETPEALRISWLPATLSSLLQAAMGGGLKPEHLLVVLPFDPPTAILDRIRQGHPHVKITFHQLHFTETPWKGREQIPPELFHDATLLVTLSALPPSPEDCPKLELIHFTSAGTNHVANSPIYTDTTIPLTTSSGIHGPQIAEWVLMTMLASSHHYALLHKWQNNREWGQRSDSIGFMRNLHDKVGQRLGVLGYGSIGRQVSHVAKAMGMDVIAYTASPRNTPESKKDHGFIVAGTGDPNGEFPSAWYSGTNKEDLHHFLAQDIDHLLISVPLTKQTTHLLGKEEFDILSKRNAFITNISRGAIIDQPALIAALHAFEDHRSSSLSHTDAKFAVAPEADLKADPSLPGLRGAALDVTDPEPLPPDDPLWNAPNCIITPHISGLGSAYVDRCFQVFEVNLDRRERGEKLINVIDRAKGY
ncbi:MAG: hypothetical protein LQ345_001602 [Seirophora villosa]|nr:MAG: hypothetical protein LQ345_001602 [Seirophora villosa]